MYFDSIMNYKRYFPIPQEWEIMQWMIKPQQALSIGIKILTF